MTPTPTRTKADQVPHAAPAFRPQMGRLYRVVTVDLDRAGRDQPHGEIELEDGLVRALAVVATDGGRPRQVSCWAREEAGFDIDNQPTALLFVLLVGRRVTLRLAVRLADALAAEWPDACSVGGVTRAEGREWALAGVHAGQVVRYR